MLPVCKVASVADGYAKLTELATERKLEVWEPGVCRYTNPERTSYIRIEFKEPKKRSI